LTLKKDKILTGPNNV